MENNNQRHELLWEVKAEVLTDVMYLRNGQELYEVVMATDENDAKEKVLKRHMVEERNQFNEQQIKWVGAQLYRD